jgi:cytochrome c-type biogenesis protein CcmH/NrfF
MQRSGMDDASIIASFVSEYGKSIFRADPNSFFWLVPYLSLAAGGAVVWFVVKRMRGTKHLKPAVAGHAIADDPVLAKYRDEIEKDTEKLN